MEIVVDPQSWLRGLTGGILIGLAAAGLMAFNGRVAGISGILGGAVLNRTPGDTGWRWLFVLGLLLGPLLLVGLKFMPPVEIPVGWGAALLAGLLVGVGTRLGNGCTSGHGVCGLARFSRRSLVATLTFMGAGFVTVFVVRHLIGG